MIASSDPLRRLGLLLASADGPVPLDRLADSGAWRPSALLSAIDALRDRGLVEVDGGREQLTWRGDRDAVLTSASSADFAALARFPACVAVLLAGARGAARERRFAAAEVLYRNLAQVEPAVRSAFPGGLAAWVALILEAARLLRSAWTVDPMVFDAAIAIAEESGDLATQAVLLAAQGVRVLSGDPDEARRLFDRSLQAAEALEAPAIRAEVRTYIAVSLVLAGRPGEGIAAFEALIGDVQPDLLDPDSALLLDLDGAVPASALSMLAQAYATLGEHPRAIDLMQRVVGLGARLQNRSLEAQGQVMLAVAFMIAGDRASAAPWAEAAAPWFATLASPYSWACALTLAWTRAATRPDEAHAILAGALPIWNRTGRFWVGGSRMLELLDLLANAGLAPLDGLTVEEEVKRHLGAPRPLLAGIAHRWAARQASSPGEARRHLAQAVLLLREAGGGPELRFALQDAVAAARSAGDRDAEQACAAELEGRTASTLGAPEMLRLASAVLELGRLGALAPPQSGLWGDVAARLCRDLGAERCAIVMRDAAGQPVVLAARGSPAWRDALLGRVVTCQGPAGPVFEAALAPGLSDRAGQLVLVPFDDGARHRGLVAIENRDTTPRVGPADEALLALLGRQMGILFANVELWRELQELRQRLEQENRYHRESAPAAPLGSGRIVGDSPALRAALELVRRVAPSMTPVLVTGESGVGKELISREVHLASPRRDGPFIAVHVASLSPGLVASALFGHERGAFTGATEQARGRFELAHGGTLFLDEVGELSLEDQVRLLRVLQEGTFERVGGTRPLRSDFRLVAATNRDLAAAVKAGRFREDLYYRLAAFPIRVAPLRERREEIPTLALFFLEQVSRKLGVEFDGISERDMARLEQHTWHGNVRELQHVIERAVLLSDPPRLRIPPLERAESAVPSDAPSGEVRPSPEVWESLEEVERRHVRRVLHHVQGKISGPGGAAEVLRLKPTTLQFWIDRLGLRDELATARRARTRKSGS